MYASLKKSSNFLAGKPGYVLNVDYIPTIQQSDLDNGIIPRYFGRKSNEVDGEIIELNESLHGKLSNSPLYQLVKLSWRISGKLEDIYVGTTRTYTGVVSANILSTLEAEKQLPGIMGKISDPLQYYQKG